MIWPGNLKKNLQLELPRGYVNGQKLGELGKLRYGLSNAGHCGCGPIAVYNAMVYLGRRISLPKVMRELEWYAASFGAYLGTFPFAVGIFFWRRHLSCKMTWSFKKLEKAEAGILAYWTKRPFFSGAHLVFYEHQADGTYRVYNRYSNRECSYQFQSLNQLTKRSRLIVGYRITKQ